MKTCFSCMEDKPEESFYKSNKGNYFSNCKECMKARQKQSYQVSTYFQPAKTYKDYLKEQGMFEYYKRYVKNF